MGTKNNPGTFDCYANAGPDEPMFVLLGRDPAAGALVREWARWREAAGENPAKVEEARSCARSMDACAMARGKHPVDHTYISLEQCAQAIFKELALHGATADGVDQGPRRGLVREMLQRAWNLGRMGIETKDKTSPPCPDCGSLGCASWHPAPAAETKTAPPTCQRWCSERRGCTADCVAAGRPLNPAPVPKPEEPR